MIVSDAANMPPTPWQTEIWAPGIWAGAIAAHLAHALLQRVHAVHAGMHVGEAAAIGVERQFAAVGGVMPGNEGAGLAARHKAQILEAADRQMRKICPWQRTGGVIDHQMVDVAVRDAGPGKGFGAGDAEGARGGEILHLADHRRLDRLAGAEEIDRFLREVARARRRPGSTRRRHRSRESTAVSGTGGDHPRTERILDSDRRLEGGARVHGGPFALHARDHRQLLVREAVGLHVAQHRDREL